MGRNPYLQKVHQERRAPKGIRHLERRRDFLKRAAKQKMVAKTKEYWAKQAMLKNPDEFHHKMLSLRVAGKTIESKDAAPTATVHELEIEALALKRQIERLEAKSVLDGRSTVFKADADGKMQEVPAAPLVNPSKLVRPVDADQLREFAARREAKLRQLRKDLRTAEQRVADARKAERAKDSRPRREVVSADGTVEVFHQTIRKK